MAVTEHVVPLCIMTMFCVNWFILTPISLYGAYRFWKLANQNIPWFTKRHPKFVVIKVILINIYPAIVRPSIDIPRHVFGLLTPSHPIFVFLSNLTHLSSLLWAIRLWLLYYDYNHSLLTLSFKWKQVILKQNTITPWTIRYKYLGNIYVISAIALGIFTCYEIAIVFSLYFFPTMNYNVRHKIRLYAQFGKSFWRN